MTRRAGRSDVIRPAGGTLKVFEGGRTVADVLYSFGLANPGALDMDIRVNGEVRQKTNTSELILGVAELISFASSFYTLYPGDILFTGTCEGVGPVHPGDTLLATIQGIGSMTVQVGTRKDAA